MALARALAPRPRLVLLDEPFSSLDAALRVETREAVARALSALHATAILVTHDQSEALSLGQEVAVLREGRLVQMAAPAMLYRQPLDADLARFVGDAVVLEGWAERGVARCRLGVLALFAGPDGPVDVMIRPEQIRLVQSGEAPDRLATVAAVTFHGPDATVVLVMSDGTKLSARVAGHRVPVPGCEVGLQVEGSVTAFARSFTELQGRGRQPFSKIGSGASASSII